MGSPAMEVSRGGAEQSEADTALVTASVVAATSCTVRRRSSAFKYQSIGQIKCEISLLLTSILSAYYFKLVTQLKNIMSACQTQQTRSSETKNLNRY